MGIKSLGLVGWLILSVLGFSQAQIQLRPLEVDGSRSNATAPSGKSRIQSTDTLELPFFDDFADYSGNPDAQKWEQKGGVLINKRFSVRPPSVGVATFDGLKANGRAYLPTSNINSPVDSLISKPLRLGSFTADDSIYLTFFWQPEGLGEPPNAVDGDSLYLQFFGVNGQWRTQWSVIGRSLDDFRFVAIPITDPLYLYDGFRFLFSSVGNPTGAYDTWNLDFISVATNRTLLDSTFNDLAISELKGRMLKRFFEMPYDHFAVDPTRELNDSLELRVNNLDNTDLNYTLRGSLSSQGLCAFADTILRGSGNLSRETNGFSFNAVLDPSVIVAENDCKLEIKFFLDSIAVIDTKLENDTLTESIRFGDYLAYDDGSAEYGIGIVNAQNGRFAVKFEAAKADTLTAVDMLFVQLGRDLSNQNFDLFVWRNLSNDTNDILFRMPANIMYGDSSQLFVRYAFPKALPVPATYYVGWIQFSSEFLNLGVDRNNRFNDRLFANTNGVWVGFSEIRDVAPMIRPIYGDPATVGFRDNQHKMVDISLFPNPSEGTFSLSGSATSVIISQVSGKIF